jgi:hypothetical protein
VNSWDWIYGESAELLSTFKTKKAPTTSPAGHDYRQPKLEEGTDAFWQVR